VAGFLEAPIFHGEGRPFPVEIRHAPRPDDRPLERQVAEAVAALHAPGLEGHILVFLPGAAEIRACARELVGTAERFGLHVLPLHGELSAEAQAEALAPSSRPKILLSTNVAESSVTLEGIAAVVDSGLGREAFHSPWSGLPGLRTARISRARCIQRAGRAGRTGPGLCVRLYTEADFRARLAQDSPELFRADLAEPVLALHGLGLQDPRDLEWFEAPPTPALDAAESLLRKLGALSPEGGLSAVGTRMAALPLHPRLARLVLAGEDAGIPGLARLGAVLLETRNLVARRTLGRTLAPPTGPVDSDLLVRLDQYLEAETHRFAAGALRASGLDPGALVQARRAFASLFKGTPPNTEAGPEAELLLRKALLHAFPDRVGRVGGFTVALVGGAGAALDPECRVRRAEFLLALDAEGGGTGRTRITLASAVDAEWLLEAFPRAIQDRDELAFDPAKGRVESRSGLWYEDLCLDEQRRASKPGQPGVAACLAAAIQALDPPSLQERLQPLLARCAFLAERQPALALPAHRDLRAEILGIACEGCASLSDLESVDWLALLRRAWPEAARLLPAWAPEEVQLPKRRVKVNYGDGPPWIASRLQDFLGLKAGPSIGGGAVPLVLHLLAPNHRAVQVTTDLAGFWTRAYQELRPQLSRRYPRHAWPEDPGKAME
jgi:ATP-dependent helicase HrpB